MGIPDGRTIYNRTSQQWTVRCESDQVVLDGNRSHAVVGAGENLRISFRRLGKNGKVPEDVQRQYTGTYRSWAYYLGAALITITDEHEEEVSLRMVLVGSNTGMHKSWTPIYLSDHPFANKYWDKETEILGDLCLME